MTTTVELDSLVLPGAPICYGILMPGEDTEGGVPVVKVRDYDHSGINVGQLLRAAPAIEAPYRRARIEPGDILMSIRGTTGVIVVVPPELVGANITQDTARIRVDATNRAFLYQALHAPAVQRQIRLHTIGQAVKGINIGAVRQLEIPWPPEPVRASIARVLGDCDTQIRGVGRLMDAKRTFKRGLMQQLLTGQKRFPQFKSRRRHLVQIEDMAELVADRVDPKKAKALLRCIDLEHIESETGRLLGETTTATSDSIKTVFSETDVLFGKLRPYLRKYARPGFVGACSTEIWALRPVPEKSRTAFLYHLLDSAPFRRAANAVSGSKMPRADWSVVAEATVWLPELDEQDRIAAVLDALDLEIELLTSKREKLDVFRRALLSKLLSGSLSVPV